MDSQALPERQVGHRISHKSSESLNQYQLQLEENCDFLSNNNVSTRSYEFFVGHFEFLWLFLISQIYWNFVHVF